MHLKRQLSGDEEEGAVGGDMVQQQALEEEADRLLQRVKDAEPVTADDFEQKGAPDLRSATTVAYNLQLMYTCSRKRSQKRRNGLRRH